MLQELSITPATIVIVAVIAVLVFFAVRRMMRKGLCDCGEKCSEKCSGCSKCPASGSCEYLKKDGRAEALHR